MNLVSHTIGMLQLNLPCILLKFGDIINKGCKCGINAKRGILTSVVTG